MKRTFAVVALLIGLVAAACGANDDPAVETGAGNGGASETTDSGGESAKDFNDADVEFAQNMIVHHQQAIEMADLVIENGESDEVDALAGRVKAKQAPEIEQLRAILDKWGQPEMAAGDTKDMPGMDMGDGGSTKMLTPEQMAKLKGAKGPEADRMFLEMMIEHHTAAIATAEAEVKSGQNAEAKALAKQVIKDQTAEKAEIEKMLEELA